MSEEHQYRYSWRGDTATYDTPDALKKAHPEACDANGHTWESSWVFAIYVCVNCKAQREVKP